MSHKFFNKKGVSPLIATVLLISFAVALGSVVLNWGRNLDFSKSGDKCSDVNIKIRDIEDVQVCYSIIENNGYINFIIDNDGSIDIDGLGIWVVGEKGTKLLDFDDFYIKQGEFLEIKDKSVVYDFSTYGTIKQIQFIPKVKIEDSIDICARNSLRVDKVEVC